MREFYSNLTFKDPSLRKIVKGVKIDIHKDQFKRMFELLFYEVSYTYEGLIKFKKLKLSIVIILFVMNLMEDRKLPIKAIHLKSKIYVSNYLVTRILLPKKENLDVVTKEYVVPLWLLTKQFQTNRVKDMLLHMIHYKQT